MAEQVETPFDDSLKEQLKQLFDELTGLLPGPVRDFVKSQSREILAGILIVLLAFLLWSGYSAYDASQERKGATALGSAMQNPDPAHRAKMLKEIINQHGRTKAADQAILLLGSAYRDVGDTDKATEYFNKAKEAFDEDSSLRQSAKMGLGYVLEGKGDIQAAFEIYKQVSGTNKGFSAVATLEEARTATMLGKRDDALSAYNRYLSIKPEGENLDFVRYQIMKLSQKDKGQDKE